MAIAKEKLPAIVERIRDGSSLGQEAKALGMSYRTTLITALRDFMGREAYDAMIAGKRPRTKSGVLLGTIDRPRPDDKGLPTVNSMKRIDGWGWRYVTEHPPRPVKIAIKDGRGQEGYATVVDGGERTMIVIDPHGIEFVRAQDNEKADLLRTNPLFENGMVLRFALWDGSKTKERLDRNHHHREKLEEHGEAAAKARKKKKDVAPENIQKERAKLITKADRAAKKEAAPKAKTPTKKPTKGKGKKK